MGVLKKIFFFNGNLNSFFFSPPNRGDTFSGFFLLLLVITLSR